MFFVYMCLRKKNLKKKKKKRRKIELKLSYGEIPEDSGRTGGCQRRDVETEREFKMKLSIKGVSTML